MQYRWYWLATNSLCLYRDNQSVTLCFYYTWHFCCALTLWLKLHTLHMKSLISTAEKAKATAVQYVWGDIKTAECRRFGFCQSVWLSPSSFSVIRSPCDINTDSRMGLRTHMGQITRLSIHLRLLAQRGLTQDCLHKVKANILVGRQVVRVFVSRVIQKPFLHEWFWY